MAEKIEFTETVEENVNMLVENGRKVVLSWFGRSKPGSRRTFQRVQ